MTNSSAAPRPTAPPRPRRRLLVAEDDPAFRRFLHDALTAQGYEVVEAKHGVELLDRLNFTSQDDDRLGDFDVVVTDYHLPGLTGLEVLEGLAAAGAAGRVVVISAFADEATVKWAISIGASAMLAKPFQIDELVEAIEKASQNPIEQSQELPDERPDERSGRS
jgi:CheY-like chemotaxis protein